MDPSDGQSFAAYDASETAPISDFGAADDSTD